MQHCLFISVIYLCPPPMMPMVPPGAKPAPPTPCHVVVNLWTTGASVRLYWTNLCKAWREDIIIYLSHLQLGGGVERAKGLPEVLRGQSCLIKQASERERLIRSPGKRAALSQEHLALSCPWLVFSQKKGRQHGGASAGQCLGWLFSCQIFLSLNFPQITGRL